MPHATLDTTYVMLCDWRGHCVWSNTKLPRIKVGDFVWSQLTRASQAVAKTALGRVVTLRENESIEVVNMDGDRFHAWLWPLNSPEVAVCVLGIRVPRNLDRLSKRERAMMELLAQGIETRAIARQLDVSLSTVHTHMRRVREKLKLRSIEALISFAARHCYPADRALSAVAWEPQMHEEARRPIKLKG
ncbi:MAG: response regulator transcription factor [Pirellulales bacterium]